MNNNLRFLKTILVSFCVDGAFLLGAVDYGAINPSLLDKQTGHHVNEHPVPIVMTVRPDGRLSKRDLSGQNTILDEVNIISVYECPNAVISMGIRKCDLLASIVMI